jgi:soluble lytic murein transglycosylase-like protein
MKRALVFIAALCFSSPAFSESVQDMVRKEAMRQGVPVNLALSIAKHESNFKCSAVGKQGERGVMQIKPSTARGIGYKGTASGLNKCQTGIHYGILYLKMAYKQAKGNAYRAAILYNAGLGTKRKRSAYAEKIVKTKLNYASNRRHKGGKR